MTDKQRSQIYVNLIEQLLGCPQEQEEDILRTNAELIDGELLIMMAVVAENMERQGNSNVANWLRQFAARLEQTLARESVSDTTDARLFWLEIYFQVETAQGNSQQIYPIWAQRTNCFNETLLKTLPIFAAQLLADTTADRTSAATSLAILGHLIYQFPLGKRWLNLELSIAAYQQALTVITKEAIPIDWAQTMHNLAVAYTKRIQGDRAENIEQAINAFQQALTVITKEAIPIDWAQTMYYLAVAYADRIRGDRTENIEQAINAYQQVLTVVVQHTMPVEWAATKNNLADAYADRIRGDRAENIEQAINYYQQVLAVRTKETMPVEWANTIEALADAYADRISDDRAKNIEQAINYYQQVLTVRTKETMPVEWASIMNNLALAYADRISGNQAENIRQTISYFQQALTVITEDLMPGVWASIMAGLAGAYADLNRIEGGQTKIFEQAITAYQQALTVITRDTTPVKWANAINNLATTYYWHTGGNRAENIEQAINYYQQVLTVVTEDGMPVMWAETISNLALAYVDRIEGNQAENIEQAINYYQQVLTVVTKDGVPVDRINPTANLAIAYSQRIHGNQAENIEHAINYYQQVLSMTIQNIASVDWAIATMNLASVYSQRIHGDKVENIEQAISYYQQALSVITKDSMPVNWATATMNLAIAYGRRIRGDRAENIEQAVVVCQQALTVITKDFMPVNWATATMNLAHMYAGRIRGDRAENIEKTIRYYQHALSVFNHQRLLDRCQETARRLGDLYSEQQSWAQAVENYQIALEASESLYQSANLLESKASVLSETADLPHRAAYAFARCGNLDQAIETLEQGRARTLSESLDRDRADLLELQKNQPDLYSQYNTTIKQIRAIENQQYERAISGSRNNATPEALRETATTLYQQLGRLIRDIRQVPSYEGFLSLPTFEDVQQAVRDNCPLVYLLSTPNGSLALIVMLQDVKSIWLDGLNKEQLIELLNNTWSIVHKQSQNGRQAWFNAIDSVPHQLWEPLMQPLIHHLKTHSFTKATLIPTGYLSFLPLHAAWVEDKTQPTRSRYALDDIHFTYVPNAKSLTAARTIAHCVQPDSILAIDNPGNDLPNSEREVSVAVSGFSDRTLLRHQEATVAAVKSQLSATMIAHFSCHGTANLTEPLNSGLLMSDGLLTLKDIFALNLAETGGLRLAVLSACETGLQGIKNADEAISLPTGLLQAGVAAVISSLWSVSDLSTMMLLTRFYDLWRTEGLEISQALRQAQQWLRDTTNGEKAAYFKDFLPTQSASKMTTSTADHLYKSLILSDPNAQDFAHPFHWAAFSYTGA